ncbi:tetratricopeptide repeat protein [Desulfobulbus sp. US4]|nr:tetratricopeptide repeat protein [Desulfobulbus sp. US4]
MSETNPYQELLEQLQACESQEERDWLSLRFSIAQLPKELQAAVRAAAVPRFFDRAFLNALLDQPLDEGQFAELLEQPYIEPYPGEGRYNVHERSRKLLQERLCKEDEEWYREISSRAFAYCKAQDQEDITWQIETIYHQIIAKPEEGADALNNTCVHWTNSPYFAYDRAESLLQAVQEHREMKRLPDKAVLYFLFRQAKVDMRYSRNQQAKDALELIPLTKVKEDDQYLAANCLQALGDVHLRLSELGDARKRYEEAMPLYGEIGDRLGQANCLQALGDVHLRLSELGDARKRYEECLAVYREIGARLGEVNCLRSLGELCQLLFDIPAAQQYYENARQVCLEINDRLGEANILEAFGKVHLMLSDYQKSLSYYEKALRLHQDIGNRQGEANCLQQLCLLYVALSKYKKAWQSCKNAFKLYRAIGFRLNLINRVRIIGKRLCHFSKNFSEFKELIKKMSNQ